MNQPIRRRRRKRLGDSNESDLSLISPTETEAGSSAEPTDTESKNEHPPSNTPQASVDSMTTNQMTIDRIRSEILEEQYHCQLDELHYSNDSYDWSEKDEFVRARLSDDLWLLALFRQI